MGGRYWSHSTERPGTPVFRLTGGVQIPGLGGALFWVLRKGYPEAKEEKQTAEEGDRDRRAGDEPEELIAEDRKKWV